MAEIVEPADILAGDKESTQPTQRISPSGLYAPGPGVMTQELTQQQLPPIDRNQLEIKAVLADGREHLLRCVQDDSIGASLDAFPVVAYTEPGELSGTIVKLKIYIRGRFHQEIEHSIPIGITQGVKLSLAFAPLELGI